MIGSAPSVLGITTANVLTVTSVMNLNLGSSCQEKTGGISLSLSLSLSFPVSPSLSLSLSFPVSPSRSLCLSLCLSVSLSVSVSLSLSLIITITHITRCPDCGGINYSRRIDCYKCSTPKPDPRTTPAPVAAAAAPQSKDYYYYDRYGLLAREKECVCV